MPGEGLGGWDTETRLLRCGRHSPGCRREWPEVRARSLEGGRGTCSLGRGQTEGFVVLKAGGVDGGAEPRAQRIPPPAELCVLAAE